MGLLGNTNIIPDDIAEKVAQSFFELLNRKLEYNIDEDSERYHMLDEWN